jgi:hypothetical protein
MQTTISQHDALLKRALVPAILSRICFLLQGDVQSSAISAAVSDPLHSWQLLSSRIGYTSVTKLGPWIVLVADIVGALCVHRLCEAVIQSEEGNHEEIDAIPALLRPERGWVFGLPSKVVADKSNTAEDESISNGPDKASAPDERRPILLLQQLPTLSSTLYLINPISALAASNSLRSLWDMLLLISIYYAVSPISKSNETNTRNPTGAKCAFFLAFAAYFDVAYAVFLLPILLWRGLWRDKVDSCYCNDWKTVLVLFVVYYGALQAMPMYVAKGEMTETLLLNLAFLEQDESGSYAGPNMGLHW